MDFVERAKEFILGLLEPPYTVLLCIGLGVFVIGAILRIVCGYTLKLSRAAAACFAILFIYVVGICAMGESAQTNILVSALPFLGEFSDATSIFVLLQTDKIAFFLEVAQLFLLAFVVNLLQDLLEDLIKAEAVGSRIMQFFIWYFWQCVIVVAGMVAIYGAIYLMKKCLTVAVAKWIPVVLLIVVAVIMFVMLLRRLIKTAAWFTNRFWSNVADFMSDNTIGSSITKAFITTAALTVGVLVADHYGIMLPLTYAGTLFTSFAPVIILCVAIWYLVWMLL